MSTIKNEPISKHTRRALYALNQDATVADAAKMMKQNNVASVLILSGDVAVGIVTHRDIIDKIVAEGKNPSRIKLSAMMSTPLITIGKDETVEKALELMEKNKIRRIIVVDENNKPYGISVEMRICGDLLNRQIKTNMPEAKSWLDQHIMEITESELKSHSDIVDIT